MSKTTIEMPAGSGEPAAERTIGVRAPVVLGESLFLERPKGPEPGDRDKAITPAPELIRLPTIHAVQARSSSDGGRLYGREEIIAAVTADLTAQGKRFLLVPCEFHNGQDSTPHNLYSYDPKTGRGICDSCYSFIKEYGTPEQAEKLTRWEEGLPYTMRRL